MKYRGQEEHMSFLIPGATLKEIVHTLGLSDDEYRKISNDLMAILPDSGARAHAIAIAMLQISLMHLIAEARVTPASTKALFDLLLGSTIEVYETGGGSQQ